MRIPKRIADEIVAHSREQAMTLADKYHDPSTFERELRLAWTKAQVEMTHLNIDAEEAHLFQRLAARIIYSDPSLRPRPCSRRPRPPRRLHRIIARV